MRHRIALDYFLKAALVGAVLLLSYEVHTAGDLIAVEEAYIMKIISDGQMIKPCGDSGVNPCHFRLVR